MPLHSLITSRCAPLILEVVESGGDHEATDTIVAQWTGQTFVNGIANEPLSTAANSQDGSALQLGLFNTGRGVADTLFSCFVEADGIYPVRLLWWEGTGDAACEFFVVEPATGARRLMNDREYLLLCG